MPKVYAIDGIIPVVDPTAFVHPTASLIGDVIVGPECYVGPGAALRGDMGRIVMKAGSNVQDNCVAHTFADCETVIGEDVTVGHGAVLHGCRIDKGVLVGMNAVVMDGAEIGAFSFIAALCFVPAGFKLPPRMIAAGSPAKVVRELRDDELAWKAQGDADYRNIARRSHASLELVEALTAPVDGDAMRMHIDGVPPLYVYRKARG
jgi:phenylacetic acid degradation protein